MAISVFSWAETLFFTFRAAAAISSPLHRSRSWHLPAWAAYCQVFASLASITSHKFCVVFWPFNLCENQMDSLNSKLEYPPAKVLYGGQVEIRNKFEW